MTVADAGAAATTTLRHVGQDEPDLMDAALIAAVRGIAAAAQLSLDSVIVAAWALAMSRSSGTPELTIELRTSTPGDAVGLSLAVDERLTVGSYLHAVRTAIAAVVPGGSAVRVAAVRPAGELAAAAVLEIAADGTVQTDTVAARRHLGQIVTGVVSSAHELGAVRLRDVASLSAGELRTMVVEWNATDRPYPLDELMHHAFERHAAGRPDAIAVVARGHQVTYRGLHARASRWARHLRAAGAGPDVVVGVHMTRSAELVAVLLGVLKAGAAYLPLDPAYPPDRLEFMAEDSQMALLVTDQPALTLHQPVGIIRSLDDGAGRPELPPPVMVDAANTAYILYTSGSTGRPKGAQLTHRNATDLLSWSADTFGDDLVRVLATTSICFDCSILEIFGPLSWGGTAVLADSALDVATIAVGHDVRLLHTVPSVMAELMRLGRLPGSVTTVLLGGEAPWPRLVDAVYGGSGVRRLVNLYGPTECTSYATMAVILAGGVGKPPIGRPVANTRIFVVDRYGNPVPVTAPGELLVGGRGVARGYLRRPALTAERFVPDPFGPAPGERVYRTGDLARYDHDGVLTFLGRVDDQVKVRGVRVEPAEVEHALLQHPDVGEAVVVAPQDGETRSRLVAYLVPSSPQVPAAEALRAHLSAALPAALVPDVFVSLDRLPRMPNGKIDRSRLPAADTAGCTTQPFVAARGDLEALIASVWAGAFELARVSVFDDFYELGGHSLAAMRIRALLSDALAIDVPVPVVFTCRTVASLAEALRPLLGSGREASPTSPARPAQAKPAPLSPNQAAVWARVRRDPTDPTLNLPLCVRITGPLNPSALAVALTELVRRHDVLRSVVSADGERPVQVTGAATTVDLPLIDLSGIPARRREAVARDIGVRAAREIFDLRRPPILHAQLLRLTARDHVLCVTLHQLVGDVWSMEAAGRQLMMLYTAAAMAERPASDDPAVQYPDWARRQVGWLSSADGQEQLTFWRERLAGQPQLRLPARGPRLISEDAAGAASEFLLPGRLIERLVRLAGEESATLYVALLAAYQVLLGAWSGQLAFAVGCPTTGRVRPDLDTTIGPFVNALVLRANLDGDPTFRALLQRARDEAWAAYANQDMPFGELVTGLAGTADPTRHPIYQASLALHYLSAPVPFPAGLTVTHFGDRPDPRTSLDRELTVYVGDSGATGILTYRQDLTEDAEIERFAAAYLHLLENVVTEPDKPLSVVAPTWHAQTFFGRP
jgi:amino acid adenylation domain-containing protein